MQLYILHNEELNNLYRSDIVNDGEV